MVIKLTPSLEETTVQGIDMKCFLIGSLPSEQWNKDMFKTYDSYLQTLQTTDFSEKYVKKLLIPYRRYVRNSKGCKKL